MNTEVVVALLGCLGTAIGSITGIMMSCRLTNYRIQQLEKKVDLHNSIIQRTYILEERMDAVSNELAELKRR